MINFDVIFDNGGGITIQAGDFVGVYNDGKAPEELAAIDVNEILNGSPAEYWEGTPEHKVQYDHEAESSGQYEWMGEGAVMDAINIESDRKNDFLENIGSSAKKSFFKKLFELRDNHCLQQ